MKITKNYLKLLIKECIINEMDQKKKNMLNKVGFGDAVKAIEAKKCPFCKKTINEKDFRNEKSKREFQISGLCMSCQDSVFGKD